MEGKWKGRRTQAALAYFWGSVLAFSSSGAHYIELYAHPRNPVNQLSQHFVQNGALHYCTICKATSFLRGTCLGIIQNRGIVSSWLTQTPARASFAATLILDFYSHMHGLGVLASRLPVLVHNTSRHLQAALHHPAGPNNRHHAASLADPITGPSRWPALAAARTP